MKKAYFKDILMNDLMCLITRENLTSVFEIRELITGDKTTKYSFYFNGKLIEVFMIEPKNSSNSAYNYILGFIDSYWIMNRK